MVQNLDLARRYFANNNINGNLQIAENSDFLYRKSGPIEVYYAPFDHIATNAKLVIVGITPGLSQATSAFEAISGALRTGNSLADALRIAKQTASFSGGVMRKNLVDMLDGIGVAELFGLKSASELFTPESEDVHFTSALRYPVFVNGANYNGAPDMLGTPILREMVETHLAEEAIALRDSIWLPLGPKAETAVMHLVSMRLLDREMVLAGLPHPSGANAERVAVFLGRKDAASASRQTNPTQLLQAFTILKNQINNLKGIVR